MTSTATEATPDGAARRDRPGGTDRRDDRDGSARYAGPGGIARRDTIDAVGAVGAVDGIDTIDAFEDAAEVDGPALFGAPAARDAAWRPVAAEKHAAAAGRRDDDPYIYGSDETILLDLRELRGLQAAERAARDQAAARELDGHRDSHRLAAEAAAAELARKDEAAMLLYADGGTAIPLARVREVCHDLRQPVAAILMLASAAEMRPDVPDSVKAALQEITDQAEDISTAVRQFLDDAKRGVDGLGDPRPVNVAGLARESVDRWRATYQGLLDFAAADDPLHVTIDPVLFRRALGNILSNATRAADVGGHVAVTVRRFQTERGPRAVVEVEDSGPGFGNIPSGHGLGLAVVRRTAEAAGGVVEFAEGSLGGALVRMVLPVTAQQQLSLEDELAASFQGEIPLSALAELDLSDFDRDDEDDQDDEGMAQSGEIADGHVLATNFSAPLQGYATPVWAARGALAAARPAAPTVALARGELAAGVSFSAPTEVISRPAPGELEAGAAVETIASLAGPASVAAPTEAIARADAGRPVPAVESLAALAAPTQVISRPKPGDLEAAGGRPAAAIAGPAAHAAPTEAIDRPAASFDAFAARPAVGAAEPEAPSRTVAAPTPAQPPAAPSLPAQHANALRLPSRANLTMPPRIPVPAGVPQVATQLSLLPGGAF